MLQQQKKILIYIYSFLHVIVTFVHVIIILVIYKFKINFDSFLMFALYASKYVSSTIVLTMVC
jgi:hypothetical protein